MVRATLSTVFQLYVMKVVSDLRQVGGFLQVLEFPPPATIHYVAN